MLSLFKNISGLKWVFAVVLVVFVVWLVPFLYVWSINTLFNTNIDYTIETWAASLFLINLISHVSYKK